MIYIKEIDPKIDNELMFKIVKYEDDEDVFGKASVGNFNISPISKYGKTFVMLNKENDEIVSVVEVMSSFNKNLAYIYGLSVSPKYRGKRYAEKMLSHVINELESKYKITIIELTVDETNIIAQNLYKKFDFESVEVLENEYGDNVKRYLYRRIKKNSHYFLTDDSLKSNKKSIEYVFNSKKFNLVTDNGVFSKNKVDFGSDLLLKEFFKDNKLINAKVLDYGCGYGIIGVVIKYFNKLFDLYSVDINERAINLTKENFKNNGIDSFKVYNISEFNENNFDYILLNPPIRTGKDNIYSMYENSYNRLNKNGIFYIVIQTKQGAKSSEKKLKEIFGNVQCLAIEDGYRIYKSIKK